VSSDDEPFAQTRRITAIIPTRNRSDRLEHALASLACQTLARDAYAVIVADSGSTDDTRAVVERFRSTALDIDYVFVSESGSSAARNAGLRRARTAYVAFMDDDAVADPDWLNELLAAFDRVEPKPVCIGGRILPLWETPKPDWFPEKYLASLSVFERGDSGRVLARGDYAVGANIAYLREAVEEIGGYEEDLRLYLDENCVQLKLRSRGYDVYYHPGAVVRHLIPRNRLTPAYLRRRRFLGGRAEVVLRRLTLPRAAARRMCTLNAVARPVLMTGLIIARLWHGMMRNSERSLRSELHLWRNAGMFVEALRSMGSAGSGKKAGGVRPPTDPVALPGDV
jgi:GT2 family glycosyltransferase